VTAPTQDEGVEPGATRRAIQDDIEDIAALAADRRREYDPSAAAVPPPDAVDGQG
jgi:hypothetical protein